MLCKPRQLGIFSLLIRNPSALWGGQEPFEDIHTVHLLHRPMERDPSAHPAILQLFFALIKSLSHPASCSVCSFRRTPLSSPSPEVHRPADQITCKGRTLLFTQCIFTWSVCKAEYWVKAGGTAIPSPSRNQTCNHLVMGLCHLSLPCVDASATPLVFSVALQRGSQCCFSDCTESQIDC